MADRVPAELVSDDDRAYRGRLARGTRLGRYELLLPIGHGGMAEVWAARQRGTRGFQKIVAIKTILPNLASDGDFEQMFLEEARVASGVHHPNVAEIFDLGDEGHVLYLAMEWVAGESLTKILRGTTRVVTPFDVRIAARIAADACAGLHAAHELVDDDGQRLEVVHRDVSPHNVLIHENGTVKMVDFGVAKALGRANEVTSAGQLKGKIGYMAPEQATGGAVDRRSDVYAMGIVLYEATTGVRPFRGDTPIAILDALATGTFATPSELVPGYPPELEAIVLTAMARKPDDRLATADRMRQALEQFLAHSGAPVTSTDVAKVVRERIGALLDQRRARIREAAASLLEDETARSGVLAASDGPVTTVEGPLPSWADDLDLPHESSASMRSAPTGSSANSLPSFGTPASGLLPPPRPAPAPSLAPAAPVAPSPSSAKPSALIVGGAVVSALLAIVAASAFVALWATSRTSTGVPVTVAPTAPVVAAVPSVVTIRVTPATARIELDGVLLGTGQRALPRPSGDEVKLLVLRADGYLSETLRLDAHVPDLVEVPLVRAAADGTAAAPVAPADGTAGRAPAPRGTATRPPPARTAAPADTAKGELPKNPFE